MRRVAAIVVTYNRQAMLKGCIASLKSQRGEGCDIIVVNNGSTDGTAEYIASVEGISVINQGNCGGAGGFFTGMKQATEAGYEYCWLMDDDVECREDALERMIEASDRLREEEYGFLCSAVYNEQGVPINCPTVDMRSNQCGYANWYDKIDMGVVGVSRATFVSVFVPCRNVVKYGLPLREFFIWGDDTEYTRRLSDRLPCYMVTGSGVVHKRGGSGSNVFLDEKSEGRLRLYYYNLRNTAYIKRTNGGLRWMLIAHLDFVKLVVQCVVRLKFRHLWIGLKAYVSYLTFAPRVEYPEGK